MKRLVAATRQARPSVASLALLLTLALTSAARLRADTPYLVHDLGQRVVEETVEYAHPIHVELDGVSYFYRHDGVHGYELWRTDGTALGTYLVRDICPGACGIEHFYTLDTIATAGSLVFFSGNDGVHGSELWVTDGTAPNTRMVADLNPGPRSSRPHLLAGAGEILYFSADDGVRGSEL